MTAALTFVLPYPSPPLRSNKRLHHMAEHRIKADIRNAAGFQCLKWVRTHEGPWPIPYRVDICLIWSVPTRHRRDASSGAPTIKSWVDGCVDAGMLKDDSFEWVRREFCEIDYRPGQPMSCRVEISQVEA